MTRTNYHVAFFIGFFGGGGIERMTARLSHSLVKLGIKVDLVTSQESPHLWQMPPEARIIDLQAPTLYMSLPGLIRYLKQEKPDVLMSADHYQNEIALMAKIISRVNTRVVVSERNRLSKTVHNATTLKARLAPLFAHFLYPYADKIIAVSQGVAKDLANTAKLPLSSIQTIYNPVISPEILESAKQPIEHKWFASDEIPIILGVGKLEAQKDFSTLIKAFAKVRQHREALLVILGWGPDRPQLELLIQKLNLQDDIDLPGYSQNPYAYMARSSVFALSSAWEGLANVLIEAMALGIPVVSTNCESGPSEVLANGKYGYLTPVGDSEALAESILQVLEGHPKKVDADWLEQFSVNTATHEYLNVLGYAQNLV
jgi:glycosyltransferase involved in cell wall biosynthesis